MMDSPGTFNEPDGTLPGPEGDTRYDIHHLIPMPFGGKSATLPERPSQALPTLDRLGIRQPVNPGMPPVFHAPLRVLDQYKMQVAHIPAEPPGPILPPAARPVPVPVPAPAPAISAVLPLPPPPAAHPVVAETISAKEAGSRVAPVERVAAGPVEAEAADQPGFFQYIDPIYPALLFYSFALGSGFFISDSLTRYAILWVLLAGMGGLLGMVDAGEPLEAVTSSDLAWGIGAGIVIGLPILVIIAPALAESTRLIFPAIGVAALLLSMVFAAPLGETLFFRGVVQERYGLVLSVLGAGIYTILLYWPVVIQSVGVLLLFTIFYTVLAGVYGYLRDRYGIASAFICQVTINLMLVVLPIIVIAPPERLP